MPYQPRLAQPYVEIKPQVTIDKPSFSTPINIELGALPLSIGLFAGSGLAFLLRGGLPNGWPKNVALGTGAVLAIGGIVNLLLPKKAASAVPAAPAAPPGAAAPPSGIVSAEDKGSGFTPPSIPAFTRAQIEVVSPDQDQTVEHSGTFLGIGTPKIPLKMRFYNPTDESVTLNLEFEWDEFATTLGFDREPQHGSYAAQVTLGPKEERNLPFDLPIVTSRGWNTLNVALAIYKKRTPDENRFLVINRSFSVS
jgi:hypothetical protein